MLLAATDLEPLFESRGTFLTVEEILKARAHFSIAGPSAYPEKVYGGHGA